MQLVNMVVVQKIVNTCISGIYFQAISLSFKLENRDPLKLKKSVQDELP